MRRSLTLSLCLLLLAGGAAWAGVLPDLRRLASAVTTTNMGLVLPVPGSTPGPTWASQLVTALTSIDAHDHTPGKGVPIPSAAINWNNNPDLGGSSILNPFRVQFFGGAPGVALDLYTNGADLFFLDGSSRPVQLTSSGGVNVSGTARGINGQYATDPTHPSVVYATGSGEYVFTTNGSTLGALKFAKVKMGVQALAGNLTITDNDQVNILLVDTTANRTITLPVPSSASAGRIFTVVDSTGGAMAHPITVQRQTSGLISGLTSRQLTSGYGSMRIVGDGSNWFVL
jgi:hypothetical protein